MGYAEGSVMSEAHNADDDPAAKKFADRVNVQDVIDREALESRRFNFPGKLLGERGIRLKRIEAIANCHVRYHGPWPADPNKSDAYIQLNGPTEQVRLRWRLSLVRKVEEVLTPKLLDVATTDARERARAVHRIVARSQEGMGAVCGDGSVPRPERAWTSRAAPLGPRTQPEPSAESSRALASAGRWSWGVVVVVRIGCGI